MDVPMRWKEGSLAKLSGLRHFLARPPQKLPDGRLSGASSPGKTLGNKTDRSLLFLSASWCESRFVIRTRVWGRLLTTACLIAILARARDGTTIKSSPTSPSERSWLRKSGQKLRIFNQRNLFSASQFSFALRERDRCRVYRRRFAFFLLLLLWKGLTTFDLHRENETKYTTSRRHLYVGVAGGGRCCYYYCNYYFHLSGRNGSEKEGESNDGNVPSPLLLLLVYRSGEGGIRSSKDAAERENAKLSSSPTRAENSRSMSPILNQSSGAQCWHGRTPSSQEREKPPRNSTAGNDTSAHTLSGRRRRHNRRPYNARTLPEKSFSLGSLISCDSFRPFLTSYFFWAIWSIRPALPSCLSISSIVHIPPKRKWRNE